MNKMLIGLALVSSIAAQAQTSSTTVPAAAPATQTSTITATEAKPADASPYGFKAVMEAYANVGDVRTSGGSFAVDSLMGLGLTYKASDKIKLEARHNFQVRNRRDSELTPVQANYLGHMKSDQSGADSPYRTWDPTLHLNYNSNFSMLGAAPMVFAARYYVPVTQESVSNGSKGIVRYQTSLSWDLNPKVNIEALLQQRIYLYSNVTSGDDQQFWSTGGTELRTIPAVTFTYNFNDKFSAYYQPYFDLIATRTARGDFKANRRNFLVQEAGMNFTVGPVVINPAFTTIASRKPDTEGYSGAGKDEWSEYDLNITATF